MNDNSKTEATSTASTADPSTAHSIKADPITAHSIKADVASSPPGRRRVSRLGLRVLVLLVATLALGNLAILGLTVLARQADASARPEVVGVSNVRMVDDHLWRGAHPRPDGFRSLAANGVTTVIDLRAERDAAIDDALMAELGITTHRIPIRDGQTPSEADVQAFLDIVGEAPGPVFVHCGAGVGRAGTMAATYLVATGQTGTGEALLRNLAVGPPSIEQIGYVAGLDRVGWDQPGPGLQAISRFFDFPRRTLSVLRS